MIDRTIVTSNPDMVVRLTPKTISRCTRSWWPERDTIYLSDITAVYESPAGMLVAQHSYGIWIPTELVSDSMRSELLEFAKPSQLEPFAKRHARRITIGMILLALAALVFLFGSSGRSWLGIGLLAVGYGILSIEIMGTPLRSLRVKQIVFGLCALFIGAAGLMTMCS